MDFHCENCGDNESTLHVHHGHYEKGVDPWEYENENLHVFCENCHEVWHKNKFFVDYVCGHISPDELARIVGYALAISECKPKDIKNA